jgi:hypothetical protein
VTQSAIAPSTVSPKGAFMSVVSYALLCYGLTAVISFLLIAIILGINMAARRAEQRQTSD